MKKMHFSNVTYYDSASCGGQSSVDLENYVTQNKTPSKDIETDDCSLIGAYRASKITSFSVLLIPDLTKSITSLAERTNVTLLAI